MVVSVSGAFYVFETEREPAREDLAEFFKDLTENDILEVRVKKPFGEDIVYHVTRFFLDNNLKFMNLALEKSDQVFQQVSRMNLHDCILPVFENGTCVNFVKNIKTRYDHFYRYEGETDMSFLNRYKKIVLAGLNEYSVELYKKALPLWTGEEVFLAGQEWRDYLDVLPTQEGIQVTVADELSEVKLSEIWNSGGAEGRLLYVTEELPENRSGDENISDFEEDMASYDDVMALTFMFSYVISPGCLNPDKKFFVIDGEFGEEGIFDIREKVFAAARYAMAKGYIPIFQIVSSDRHKYSDAPGEDIWNKFFLQPSGYTMKEVHNSSYLALSPNMNLSPAVRHFMDRVSGGTELSWVRGMFNGKVKKYMKERQEELLPHPQRALGVFAASCHAGHAPAEAVIHKIHEIERAWDFDCIYLLAEDEAVSERLSEEFGDRVISAESEEYGCGAEQEQTAADSHGEEGAGFRLGADYLCSVSLLSHCGNLIASGDCAAVREVVQENEGRYRQTYVFAVSGQEE